MASSHRPRFEDYRLLTGRGRFADDGREAGEAHAVFVRSPYAFARIGEIDVRKARSLPGVLAVLLAEDMAKAGVGNVSVVAPVPGGAGLFVPHRPALAHDFARHVGEPVALVVALSEDAAREGAEAVSVAYEELPAVAEVGQALAPDAPLLWEEAPDNLAIDWKAPSEAAWREVEHAFADASRLVRVRLANQRIIVNPLEPRGALALYDEEAERFILRSASQSAFVLARNLAEVMGLPAAALKVENEDVGGAFGMRTSAYPEHPALLVAARLLRRPVRWLASRSECFLSDNQARDSVMEGVLALDGEGRFTGLRIEVLANMGAYLTSHAAFISTANFLRCLPGMYDIPRVAVRVRCVFTNTVPTGPYRGAGRPEANYCLERLIDRAARESGIDRIELRRRNLIAPEKMPYRTAVGTTYDSGDFRALLNEALKRADVTGFAARRDRSAAAGRRRGLGVSCFLEIAGGQPGEGAFLSFPGESRLLLAIGVQASGQGHETVYRRLAAERLQIPVESVAFAPGDSDFAVPSAAAVASRSTMSVGGALVATVEALIAKGRRLAAHLFEAAEADVIYREGTFEIAGTDRRIALFELALRARDLFKEGAVAETLDTRGTADVPPSFPNGCHVAEVEIDPETGSCELLAYTAVDDCGRVLEPVLVEGQVQGGVAQGAGQALLEWGTYDEGSGQLLSGSFMDYALPRADTLPPIAAFHHPVPCRTNALGVKGVGEAGTTAALAAVMSAVADALPQGAEIDMPASAERIWRALGNTL